MKVRVTLNFTDEARRCIAANMAAAKVELPYLSTQAGGATRRALVHWLEQCARTASAAYVPKGKADPLEREETRLAVEQLRAAGWPDARIRAWLLKQAALMEGVRLNLWDEPILSTYDAHQPSRE